MINKIRCYPEKHTDQSCYDTMMLYEVNDEREDAFNLGVNHVIEMLRECNRDDDVQEVVIPWIEKKMK